MPWYILATFLVDSCFEGDMIVTSIVRILHFVFEVWFSVRWRSLEEPENENINDIIFQRHYIDMNEFLLFRF